MISMDMTLQDLFNRIERDIRNDDINGFKNLLFLIYQNINQGENNPETRENIYAFVLDLFNNGIVVPPNYQVNKCDCPEPHMNNALHNPLGQGIGQERTPITRNIALVERYHDLIPNSILESMTIDIERKQMEEQRHHNMQ